MPSLQQLRYLVAVAETRHFRRAAERCNVTQPTLSAQLRALEGRLNVILVERGRGTAVVLTPLGVEIARRARGILREVGDLTELAAYGRLGLSGTTRLGVLPTIGPYFLPHILPNLHRTYPSLGLFVREAKLDALLHMLAEGELDLLIVPLPLAHAEISTVMLFREPLTVVLPADHRLAGRPTIAREDLAGEVVLALERGHRLHEQVRDLCRDCGARLSLDFEGTSLDALRLMVGMGMGVTLLPVLYARSEASKDDQVAIAQLRPRPPNRTIGMAWRRRSSHADDYRRLAEIIRDWLRQNPPGIAVM